MSPDQWTAFIWLFAGLAALGAIAFASRYRDASRAVDAALATLPEPIPPITDQQLHALIDAYNAAHPHSTGEADL